MSVVPSGQEMWTSCPQCHRPMPPEGDLCSECQTKKDLQGGIEKAKSGDYAEALRLFKNVCKSEAPDKEQADGYYYSGVCLLKLGQTDKGKTALKKCLLIDPGYQKAKKRLIEMVSRVPKKQWDDYDRSLMEKSPFNQSAPKKIKKVNVKGTRRLIALAVFVIVFGVSFWVAYRSVRYFNYGRHIEQVKLLVNTNQLDRSLQYFNDAFQGHKRRKEAEQELAPVYKKAALDLIRSGDKQMGGKLLRVAAGFAPNDQELKDELERLFPAGDSPSESQ